MVEVKISNMVAERRLTAMMLQEAQVRLESVRSQEFSRARRVEEEAVLIGLAFSPNTTQSQVKVEERGARE